MSLLSIPVGQRYTTILDRLGIIEERLNGLAKVVNDVDLRIEEKLNDID